MGSLSIWHWLLVLGIVMLVFGTGKLRTLGTDLGGALRGFKQAVNEGAAAPGAASSAISDQRNHTGSN